MSLSLVANIKLLTISSRLLAFPSFLFLVLVHERITFIAYTKPMLYARVTKSRKARVILMIKLVFCTLHALLLLFSGNGFYH